MSAKFLVGCGALALAIGAGAQYPPYRGYSNNGPGLIRSVLEDLNRAESYSYYLDRHERHHFEEARHNLARFEDNWRRGHFDRGRLDGAIDNIQHLVNADRVDARERRVLWRDLGALRSFRAQRDYRWTPY